MLFAINQLGVSGKNGIVIATRTGIAPHIMQATRQVVTAPTTYTRVIPALTVSAPLPPIQPLIHYINMCWFTFTQVSNVG